MRCSLAVDEATMGSITGGVKHQGTVRCVLRSCQSVDVCFNQPFLFKTGAGRQND